MKKVSVIVISVLLFFSVAVVAINYLYPYYVHLSSVKYANVGMTATQFAVPTPEDARRYVAAIAAHTNKNVKLA